MASEKLFYVNRRKRKKRFWNSHYLAKRAQVCASGSSVAEIWSMSEKISLFSLLHLLSLRLLLPFCSR